jgi:hypothetical protein
LWVTRARDVAAVNIRMVEPTFFDRLRDDMRGGLQVAEAGAITVKLVLDTTEFYAALEKANQDIQDLARALSAGARIEED